MHDEEKILGYNVSFLRKKHRLSKKALAKRIGIGVKSLSTLERGVIPPRMSINAVFRLCKVFHVLPRALFSVLPETQPSTEEEVYTISL